MLGMNCNEDAVLPVAQLAYLVVLGLLLAGFPAENEDLIGHEPQFCVDSKMAWRAIRCLDYHFSLCVWTNKYTVPNYTSSSVTQHNEQSVPLVVM